MNTCSSCHHYLDRYSGERCAVGATFYIDPVTGSGWKLLENAPNCRDKNSDGKCKDYARSLARTFGDLLLRIP